MDLGDGIQGLIHISELSSRHVGHPSEIVRVGQAVRVRVLTPDRAKKRVALSLKGIVPVASYQAPLPSPPKPAAPQRAAPSSNSAPKRLAEGEGRDERAAIQNAAAKLGLPGTQVVVIAKRAPQKGLFGNVKQLAWVRVQEQ